MSYAIEMLNITKTFGTLVANDDISFRVKKGEVHAILGENGAGKSTLMSILFGLYKSDSGVIKINNEEVSITNPNVANDYRIGMVHQHFKLIDVFTVLENIILGQEVTKKGFLEYESSRKKIEELSNKYKLNVSLDAYIKDISVGMQQRVEILKMLYRDADILIFDEPTAVLTPQEIEGLFDIIREFAKEGKSIIIITHKLNEIKDIADNCTILRKGKYIGTVDVKKASVEKLAEMMVGREVNFEVKKSVSKPKDVVLKVSNLNLTNRDKTKNILTDINFEVRSGEIVCIAGIEGNGQTELVQLISGLLEVHDQGSKIYLNDTDITKYSIRKRNDAGMSHIPEDRQKHGLILDYSMELNMVSNSFYKDIYQNKGFLNFDNITNYAKKLLNDFDIRSSMGEKTIVRSMSGGNQQKVIIARETSKEHDFLIASQPTRGLDVGAMEYVHSKLIEERDNGKAILVISLELDEVMNIADRILVIYDGKIQAELNPKKVNKEEVGRYMLGTKKEVKSNGKK
ncbi:ABC transporter ATP-binding protein [Haploplasma axanthum]|nr:ABC transporter ATP-binding protein [Haploplasma axanthum]